MRLSAQSGNAVTASSPATINKTGSVRICLLTKLMPQVFNIPKVEHDQPCSTLVVIVFQISLFIYVILGPDWSMAKVKVNKQTNLQKQ